MCREVFKTFFLYCQDTTEEDKRRYEALQGVAATATWREEPGTLRDDRLEIVVVPELYACRDTSNMWMHVRNTTNTHEVQREPVGTLHDQYAGLFVHARSKPFMKTLRGIPSDKRGFQTSIYVIGKGCQEACATHVIAEKDLESHTLRIIRGAARKVALAYRRSLGPDLKYNPIKVHKAPSTAYVSVGGHV